MIVIDDLLSPLEMILQKHFKPPPWWLTGKMWLDNAYNVRIRVTKKPYTITYARVCY